MLRTACKRSPVAGGSGKWSFPDHHRHDQARPWFVPNGTLRSTATAQGTSVYFYASANAPKTSPAWYLTHLHALRQNSRIYHTQRHTCLRQNAPRAANCGGGAGEGDRSTRRGVVRADL